MKRIVFVVTFVTGLMLPLHTSVHCAACFTNPCLTSAVCGRGCTCMKKGMDVMGECVSFDTRTYDLQQEEE
jgi:hypothetical protein